MKWLQAISIFILVAATLFLGYVPQQSDFSLIIISGAFAFLGYGYVCFKEPLSFKNIFIVGILLRVILIFAFPNLSDDIYRFIWDGELTSLGINPYGHLPSDLVNDRVQGLSSELYLQMNSPDYYTIYPPLAQLIFYISTWFSDDPYYMGVAIKLIFLLAEAFTFLGIIRLLKALNKKPSLSAIYFLNPLILVEGMVNLHFEIIMITFLIWSIYFLFIKQKIALGALLMTLSIASKLLPLMFLPFFLFGLKGRQRIQFFLLGFTFFCIAFLPIAIGVDFQNFASSIDLYFQKFEFNASIYYLLRFVGKVFSGYNLIYYIGPLLGALTLFLILKKAYLQRSYDANEFLEFSFFAFVSYLLLATTIHPWYLSIPILLSVFVRWRFTVLWSFLILLTYINYSYESYWENLWVVGLEYVVVIGVLVYEMKMLPRRMISIEVV